MGVVAIIKGRLGNGAAVYDSLPLRVTPFGFEWGDASAPCSIEWNDVIEIRAFKIDLFTVDEVRFAVSLRDGTDFELSEEHPAFGVFVDALKVRFPTVEGWENRVIQPAFATNMTVLFRGT